VAVTISIVIAWIPSARMKMQELRAGAFTNVIHQFYDSELGNL